MAKKFKVKLKKSVIGCNPSQRATVKGLGLRRLNSVVEVPDTPEFRGMIFKIQHLLEVRKGN
ncbi:MAG: 50S ribosomal protein L30 [Oligoflexia bacterium]|nr:50S ribosomal protein L30 [Oligoflexia bacterium]